MTAPQPTPPWSQGEKGTWTTDMPRRSVPTQPVVLPPQVGPTPSLLDTEPVALAGAVQGVLSALLAVLLGFGVVHMSDEQTGLILSLYTAVVVAVQAAARSKVWSPASVARLIGRRP